MKIVFMGTPNFAKNILLKLIEAKKYDVVAVYTKEDAVRGRGNKLVVSPVKELAISQNIQVETPKNLKDENTINKLKNFNPDFICVASYGVILPKEVLEIPKACLNIHGSLLPKWRGAAPIQRAILAGDKKIGTSIMKMDEGMDTGDYCLQSEIEVGTKNLNEIFDELATVGAKDLMFALDNFDNLEWISQNENDATYAEKLQKKELWLKNSDTPEQAFRKIQTSSKEAPAKCCIAGRNVTILEAELIDSEENVQMFSNQSLKITRLKPDGKNEMNWDAFVAGVQDKSEENLRWREIE